MPGLFAAAAKDGYAAIAPSGQILTELGPHLVKLDVSRTKKELSSQKKTPQLQAVYHNGDGSITDFIAIVPPSADGRTKGSIFRIIQLIAALMGRDHESFTSAEYESFDRAFGSADVDERAMDRLVDYVLKKAKENNRAFWINLVPKRPQAGQPPSAFPEISVFPPNHVRAASDSESAQWREPADTPAAKTTAQDDDVPLP